MSIKKKHMITVVLLIAVALTGFIAYRHRIQNSKITYKDHLDDVVVQVNDQKLTLKDAAYYVAYEEKTVEEQAVVYDPDNTNKYWNLHIDGEFVRVAASNAVVNMLIHDEIFYELAVDESRTGTLVYEVPMGERDFSISYKELFDNDTEGDTFFVYFTAKEQ